MVEWVLFYPQITLVSTRLATEGALDLFNDNLRFFCDGSLKAGFYPEFHLVETQKRQLTDLYFDGFNLGCILFLGLLEYRPNDGLSDGDFVHL